MNKADVLAQLLDVHEVLFVKHIGGNKSQIPHMGRIILKVLFDEGKKNQRQLSKLVKISPQATSENIKKLEALELIVRENGQQKNENFISLTQKGKDLALSLKNQIEAHAEDALKDFSNAEIATLQELLHKLIQSNKKEVTHD